MGVEDKYAPKPYSGPVGFVGWWFNVFKFLFKHYHNESFYPHLLLGFGINVKLYGFVDVAKLVTGQFSADITMLAALFAFRNVILSMTYIYFGDWYNDVCDIYLDARNKPSRPIPAGQCSQSQGLMIAAIWLAAGGIFGALYCSFWTQVAFWCMCLSSFLYSDTYLPTQYVFRRTAVGRAISFAGIYFFLDMVMYAQFCHTFKEVSSDDYNMYVGTGLANALWYFSFLLLKDMGDVPGDKAGGMSTLPMILGKYSSHWFFVILTCCRLIHIYAIAAGVFPSYEIFGYGGIQYCALVYDVAAICGVWVYALFFMNVDDKAHIKNLRSRWDAPPLPWCSRLAWFHPFAPNLLSRKGLAAFEVM